MRSLSCRISQCLSNHPWLERLLTWKERKNSISTSVGFAVTGSAVSFLVTIIGPNSPMFCWAMVSTQDLQVKLFQHGLLTELAMIYIMPPQCHKSTSRDITLMCLQRSNNDFAEIPLNDNAKLSDQDDISPCIFSYHCCQRQICGVYLMIGVLYAL